LKDSAIRGIVLGGLASQHTIGVYSLVDFNLHLPANVLTVAVILGLLAIAAHLTGSP
jgi:hypothetical protein